MNELAHQYVQIVLGVGEHDEDYVDAFYGPADLRDQARQQHLPLDELRLRAQAAIDELRDRAEPDDSLERLRHRYLVKQLSAVIGRIDMLSGKRFSFDAESRILYDAVSPHYDEAFYQRLIDDI